MKNLHHFLAVAALTVASAAFAQQQNFHGDLRDATIVSHSKYTSLPNFVRLAPGTNVAPDGFADWLHTAFALDQSLSFQAYSTEHDKLGMTHIRYREYLGNNPIENTMIIAHVKDGHVVSFNGDYYQDVNPALSSSVTEAAALQSALNNVGAQKYRWEDKADEEAQKKIHNDPSFTFYPKGSLVVVHKNGSDYSSASLVLAWKFDIYAETPLSRAYVYVDAQTSAVVAKQSLIHDADVVGSASTVYSGNVTMTSDNFSAGNYRLRETGRGQGIETYNLNNTTNYGNAVDFTNNSSTWNLSPPDQAATDAHWGAEMTYDYYNNVHGRNSIDGSGFALLSYVHYSNNFVNAFWDGQEMTYGDGNVSQGYTIMTGLDVCGHEITHGLTTFTANLNGGEADALNEGFSDIFGTTIEHFARPTQWDWLMGNDISTNGLGFRNMADPHTSAYPGPQPDTYLGQYWDATGEPHNNNGPLIYWYYLLCQGGSGTNDNSDAYNITGIGMNEAQMIAFRGLTVYATPSTDYADARVCTIQAALDLYGACTPEVQATTDAWYAVGVGPAYSSTVTASFTSSVITACTLPLTVNFSNTSANATNASWDFGDNTTSTQYNPSHTYTQDGTYNVSLAVNSACGTDSIMQNAAITISTPPLPTAADLSSCASASFNLTGTGTGTLAWYTQQVGGSPVGTGSTYTTPVLNSTTTYYVANTVPQTPGSVGPTDNTFGGGGNHNNTSTQYLEFTVYQPCTLVSGTIYAGASGNRTFTLWDNSGNLISNYPVNVPTTGQQVVTLNIPLTPGSYRLGGTQMNMYRNNSGASFPYTYNGILDITGSSAGPSYYYYLYNWTVQPAACSSPRIPVTCTVGALQISFSTTGYDTVCLADASFLLNATPAGGTFSGTGVTGNTFDPSTANAGNNAITYTYTDTTANCTGSITQNIYVSDCVGITEAHAQNLVTVYPNPANDQLNIDLHLTTAGTVTVQLIDVLGQIVYTSSNEQNAGDSSLHLNTANLPRGVYMLSVKTVNGTLAKKVELN